MDMNRRNVGISNHLIENSDFCHHHHFQIAQLLINLLNQGIPYFYRLIR